MPLPKKPLSKRASKKKKRAVMQSVMHDLKHGPHHKDRTRDQEIAIGLKLSGQDWTGGKKSPKRKKRK